MRWTLFIALTIVFSLSSYSQLDPFLNNSSFQSSHEYDWLMLENDYVEVIFPKGWETVAQRSANFVEGYAQKVGESFGIEKPKKFPLVLRPNVALPNGFVALAPRRSEWYVHQSFSPLIGGLDFIDALAIHEYRHVNQFDFSLRRTNKVGYWFFGEIGLAVFNVIGMPFWYFEGDAVWSETKFTQGGRGRSPRFYARLKAILLSGQMPSYDQLQARSYDNNLPNHYVYGYFIVARGYRMFGPDFWGKVFNEVTGFSLNPYRIYSKFEEVSGVEFETFVADTFDELKSDWQQNGDHLDAVTEIDFIQRRYPLRDGDETYFLERKLNGYWTLRDNEKVLKELAILPDLSKVDLKEGKLLYVQRLPALRYAIESTNDVFIYDLKEDSTIRISDGRRLYHPQWAPDASYVIALEKRPDGIWSLVKWQEGEWSDIPFSLGTPLEMAFLGQEKIAVIFQNLKGEKALAKVDLQLNREEQITEFTRNNIFSLRSYNEGLLFEADWKGRVQAFYLRGKRISQCTFESVMARNPYADKNELYYMSTRGNGEELATSKMSSCRVLTSNLWRAEKEESLPLAVKSYGKSEPVQLDYSSKKKLPIEKASVTLRGMTPNSWSFVGGRGYQLQVSGSNYLGDISYSARVGEDSEEQRPFGDLSLSYNRFPIIITGYSSYEKRYTNLSGLEGKKEWDELEYGFKFSLPLRWAKGLYRGAFTVATNIAKLDVSERYGTYSYRENDEVLDILGGEISFSYTKNLRLQEIYPRYGFQSRFFYRTIDSNRRSDYGTDVLFAQGTLFLPGILANHGLKIQGTIEEQDEGINNYRHDPIGELVNSYVFSRGFSHFYVDKYTKGSVDYAFPLFNANWNLFDFHFLRRLTLNTFYDFTRVHLLSAEADYKSFGGELTFDVNLFRRFPLSYGVRYSNKVDSNQDWDFFLGTQVAF